jgi:hypothetical protein
MENAKETVEFRTEITTPKSVGVNEPFNIEAKLIHSSNKVFSIMYEDQIFEFYIADENNQRFNSYAKKSLGVVDNVDRDSERKQVYPYTIDKKGSYIIWAVARFKVEGKDYEIKTDTLSIEIK